jgi:hypothetical protein
MNLTVRPVAHTGDRGVSIHLPSSNPLWIAAVRPCEPHNLVGAPQLSSPTHPQDGTPADLQRYNLSPGSTSVKTTKFLKGLKKSQNSRVTCCGPVRER